MTSIRTLEPVTLVGWYENTDGSVTHYEWRDGILVTMETARDWEAVGALDALRRRDEEGG